jgi:geranyl-CoA carboxylase alpha subunit
VRYRFDGIERSAVALQVGSDMHLALGADSFVFAEPSAFAAADAGVDASRLRAPVAGVLTQLLAQPGDDLAAGQPVACVEAMKMEMWLAAPFAARVVAVHARAGDQLASGALIAELEPIQEPT